MFQLEKVTDIRMNFQPDARKCIYILRVFLVALGKYYDFI